MSTETQMHEAFNLNAGLMSGKWREQRHNIKLELCQPVG